MAQKYLKELLPLTVITGSPRSPYNSLLQHLSSPLITVNVAPRRFRGEVQVNVFEKCGELVQCVERQQGTQQCVERQEGTQQCVDRQQGTQKSTVLINNISLWVLYVGLEAVYRDLVALRKQYKVVGVVIESCHTNRVLDTLYLLANTVITLDKGLIKSSIRRETGKMSLHTEKYIVSEGRMVISKMRVRQEEVEEEKKVVDVTFNMGIKASEEAARANTTLPYTHAAQQQQSTIHYVPDEDDDWDDEDPDDDLDI